MKQFAGSRSQWSDMCFTAVLLGPERCKRAHAQARYRMDSTREGMGTHVGCFRSSADATDFQYATAAGEDSLAPAEYPSLLLVLGAARKDAVPSVLLLLVVLDMMLPSGLRYTQRMLSLQSCGPPNCRRPAQCSCSAEM